jgi:hypothetical protein
MPWSHFKPSRGGQCRPSFSAHPPAQPDLLSNMPLTDARERLSAQMSIRRSNRPSSASPPRNIIPADGPGPSMCAF